MIESDQQNIQQVFHSENQPHFNALAEELLKKLPKNERSLVAIVGPPGSGKSFLAAGLASLINQRESFEIAIVVGQDGWHYPNDYLDRHTIKKGQQTITLRSIKGAPESFDAAAAIDCLRRIKQGEEVSFPIYSRVIHNPIPNAARVCHQHKLILCEGNYWLLNEMPWQAGIPLFSLRIFIQVEGNTFIPALRERHLRGGKTSAEVERQLMVDLENAERIIHHSVSPHIIVEKENPYTIKQIKFLMN